MFRSDQSMTTTSEEKPESLIKQQRRRRRKRKHHLKSEFALLQSLSRLFHLVWFVKRWQFFLELNSKGLYQSSGKEKESGCLVFPSSTKRQFRHFHVVVVQQRQRNVQKNVIHVQSCFFAVLVAVAVVLASALFHFLPLILFQTEANVPSVWEDAKHPVTFECYL